MLNKSLDIESILCFINFINLVLSTANIYCLLWLVTYHCQSQSSHPFKECFVPLSHRCRISQSTPLEARNVSFPSPTDVGSHNPPPWRPASSLTYYLLSGSDTICNSPNPPASSLTYYLLSGSDTICNSPNPPPVDIVRFGSLRISVNLIILKRVCWGGFPHRYKECFVPFSPKLLGNNNIWGFYRRG